MSMSRRAISNQRIRSLETRTKQSGRWAHCQLYSACTIESLVLTKTENYQVDTENDVRTRHCLSIVRQNILSNTPMSIIPLHAGAACEQFFVERPGGPQRGLSSTKRMRQSVVQTASRLCRPQAFFSGTWRDRGRYPCASRVQYTMRRLGAAACGAGGTHKSLNGNSFAMPPRTINTATAKFTMRLHIVSHRPTAT